MGTITVIHKATGEQLDFQINSLSDLVSAWRMATEYEKMAKDLKDKLKPYLADYLNDDGTSDEVNGYKFKSNLVTRRNYDKAIMRKVFDEDTLDLLLEPAKTKVDNYIKEHLSELGEDSSLLRETMIDVSKPYVVTKLEKL